MSRSHSDLLFRRQMQRNNGQQTIPSCPPPTWLGRDACGGPCDDEVTATPSRDGTSTLIDRAMRLRREKQTEWAAPLWALLNLSLAAIVYVDLSGNLPSLRYGVFTPYPGPVWCGKLALAAMFSLNALVHLWMCFRSDVMGPSTIAATPRQHALLGLRNSGIQATPPPPPLQGPFQSSAMLGGQNVPSFSPSRPPITTTTSDPNLSPSCILGSTPSSCSLGSPASGPGVGARYHRTSSPSVFSPAPRGNEEDYMADLETLERFLHAEEEKDHQHRRRSRLGGPPESTTSWSYGPPATFWNYNRSVGDYSGQSLRRFQYQPACRYSPAPSSARKDADDADAAGSNRLTAAEVWARVGGRPVSADRVGDWTANLRKWISDTILTPLAEEVDVVNGQLRRTGSPEVQVGETAVGALRQAAASNASSVPTLSAVVRYLDVTADQEYLLDRIRELAHGGSMSCFRWNAGGDPKTGRRQWRPDLPTDAAIVAHAFSTYMDSRLPAHPRHPDGKTFTSQYFDHTPAAKAAGNKALPDDGAPQRSLCIRQGAANPPRYQLLHRGHVYSLPEDRNNLFHTLLLFLYAVRTHMHGMLGRVSLGPSGVNILWIFTD